MEIDRLSSEVETLRNQLKENQTPCDDSRITENIANEPLPNEPRSPLGNFNDCCIDKPNKIENRLLNSNYSIIPMRSKLHENIHNVICKSFRCPSFNSVYLHIYLLCDEICCCFLILFKSINE